jgi:hypothetical protein
MDVDTGQFAALRDEVDELRSEVAELLQAAPLREAFVDAIAARSYRAGQESVLGRPARPQPSHLRAVDGGAS